MEKKASLPKSNRQKRYDNQDEIERLTAPFKKENAELYAAELAFREEAKKILLSCTPTVSGTILRVSTQTGRRSSIVRKYIGNLEYKFGYSDSTFNFVDRKYNDGKPFTIGFSCLLSIEIVK